MTTQDEAPIRELHRQWSDAELTADVDTLDTLLDEGFVGVGPLGFTLTKEEWLDRHRSGDLKYQQISTDEVSVRQYGDAAVLIAAQTQQATYKGNPVPQSKIRVTHVAVRTGDRWVFAGLHISPMGPPPGPPPGR